MWKQLPGAAPSGQIRQQNQHELRLQQWSGEWGCQTTILCTVLYFSLVRLTWDMFPSCPGGAGSTQSSPCCRSSGDSCCSRRTWSSASPQRAPPIRWQMRFKKNWSSCTIFSSSQMYRVLNVLQFSLASRIKSSSLKCFHRNITASTIAIILLRTQTTLSDKKISTELMQWKYLLRKNDFVIDTSGDFNL